MPAPLGPRSAFLNALTSSPLVTEHDGVVFTDQERRILHVNAAGLALFGYDAESDVLGKRVDDFVTSEDLPRAIETTTNIRHTAAGGPAIICARRQDGQVVRTECGVSTMRDPYGVFLGFLIIFHVLAEIEPSTGEFRVVTPAPDRRSSADRVPPAPRTEAERRLLLVATSAEEGLFEIDIDTDELSLTPRFVELLRIALPGGTLPRTVEDLLARVHPDDRERFRGEIRVAGTSAEGFDAMCRVRVEPAEYRWFRFRLRTLQDDHEPTHLVGFMADVTEQHRQSLLLHQATHMARMAAWQYSRDTGVLEQTGEFYNIFEVDPNEVPLNIGHFADGAEFDPGRSPIMDRFLTPESQARFEERRRLAILTGEGWDLELEAVTAKGRRIWVRHMGTTEFSDGRMIRAYGALQDITAQRQLQDQLAQARKLESIGHLTSGIAHDFNNLLTVIRGHLELALADVPGDSQLAKDLTEVDRAARSASVLTQQLLVFSRKEQPTPVAQVLPTLMTGMEKTLRKLMGPGVDLCIDAPPDLWSVCADASQMDQLFMNLCINAADAMGGDGRLFIGARNVTLDQGDEARDLLVPGDYVELRFRDTGPGMPPDVVEHAFDPFFTTKGEGRGTGLGLSICRRVVDAARGDISIVATSSEGSVFRVRIPRLPESPAVLRAPHHARGSETLVVCDDEASLRALISAGLRAYGYRVLEARDPSGALAIAQQHDGAIDMLVTDVLLPEMSGKGLASAFLAMRPDAQVLFMSGLPADAIARSGERVPATPFIAKPFSPSTLAHRVREILDGPPNISP